MRQTCGPGGLGKTGTGFYRCDTKNEGNIPYIFFFFLNLKKDKYLPYLGFKKLFVCLCLVYLSDPFIC
eukprot:COSAG04_NODE_11720_length_692_cov_1.602024_3_plen_67_part_01